MNLSDQSDEDSIGDESQAAKRPRTDTYGASSTTSYGSAQQESEDDTNMSYTKTAANKIFNYKERISFDSIRLSQSSLENCSSPYESNDEYRPGFSNDDVESDTEKLFASENKLNTENNDSYSDKIQRMMNNMGYKFGKGLGKFEQGRVEPVQASNQKGRRGLGLMPSTVGEIPEDFKWTPDDDKPEAKEVVEWLDPSPDELLSEEQLQEWLQKGEPKLNMEELKMEDETTFVEPHILKGVLNAKNIFDTLDEKDLKQARFRSNPYETIRGVIFLNRAAVKMANLDAICDFMFTNPLKPNGECFVERHELLYFADVCAGPGGFSEYVLYRRGWRSKGFGFTLRTANDFKLSDFYAGPPETFNPYYGVRGDGDIYKPENLASLKSEVLKNTDEKGVHFLMADGGFSVEGQENLQEILSKQLYLCQCLAALMLVRPGGHFVVKMFDVFTKFSVGLIYIMYRCFDRVSIHKPVTSRPANSERYLICKWKRLNTESIEKHLYAVNSTLWNKDADITELVPLSVIQNDKQFFDYVYNSNCVIGEKQIKGLLKIAEFSKDPELREPLQADMREQCLQLWQLPDKVRTQERYAADQTLVNIISELRLRPIEGQSPIVFKNSILSRPPLTLDKEDALNMFKSVYDWHFVFLNNGKGSSDISFFIGCGGKQVYQLDGIKWRNVEQLHINLPAKTLLYGEIVKEYRGEGNTQLFAKALHVIDALMLGGEDISYLPLTERIQQCALFCKAIQKPFQPQSLPIRCKNFYNMEHLPNVLQNELQCRATKRIKKAVTVCLPPQQGSEMFYTIDGVLFFKEIKEPWEARMSKSSGHKYYFGIDKERRKRSEYHIPEEARLDMLSAYCNRVLWSWDPAYAVLEGLPHNGLPRSAVESYIVKNIAR